MTETTWTDISEAPNADVMPNRLDRLTGVILSINYVMLLLEESARKMI
jgi:hypothetical protein